MDNDLQPVGIGEVGELYVGGAGLARGYLNREDLTQERFINVTFPEACEGRLYRTGDCVRYDSNGFVEYLGRTDTQVKIRGFRIELGEIETALCQEPGVQSCAVLAREDIPGNKRLVAYCVADTALRPDASELRAALRQRLPEYMLPTAFVWLEALPVTINGKLDRQALPKPDDQTGGSATSLRPRNPTETALCAVLEELLGTEAMGVRQNIFELGANSLLIMRAVARLRDGYAMEVPLLLFFQHPTVEEVARAMRGIDQENSGSPPTTSRRRQLIDKSGSDGALEHIAIIGMAGRFPGARSVSQLWRNLREGVESTRFFSESEIDPEVPASLRDNPDYVRARGVLDDVQMFDAGFFGISPLEAQLTDPQQRIILEIAWETLEDAGYVSEIDAGVIGVFAGKYNNSYFSEYVSKRADLVERLGAFQTMIANEKDYVATRIAHKLNLTGPAISVHTACSTSLVAIAQAVHSLQLGECDMALAGGVSVTCPPNSGYLYQEGSMLSGDGHTRPFDANAQGTVFSDGAGMVLLRRLGDALAAGDHIYAVIRGAATNNDGSHKASFTAPSIEGQAKVISMAQAMAEVEPHTIGYVETHGTATPLGDPIEIQALTRVFAVQESTGDRTQDDSFTRRCAVGSIKSNFGHLVIAAGVAGLIKTALSLQEECIPPTLHYQSPNPKLELDDSPFYVNAELTPWRRGSQPRRAGISAFGVGGTNAHVVLEEAPVTHVTSPTRPLQLLNFSARTQNSLSASLGRFAQFFAENDSINLADVAYTLDRGRRDFTHRFSMVCSSAGEASTLLQTAAGKFQAVSASVEAPRVAFMFPGQGSQFVHMGADLYRDEPMFRQTVDELCEQLKALIDVDLRPLLYPSSSSDADVLQEQLRETHLTQPAIFVIEYALAKVWQSFGVRPAAMIGHSVGEFVCAVLAGVMQVDDALMLVAERGRMMQGLPPGSMLSVRLPAHEVEKRIADKDLSIASYNSPQLVVVAGDSDAVRTLERELGDAGIAARTLLTSHAFHSAMMDPVVEPFANKVRTVTLSPPQLPFVSTVTGAWITAEEATDPMYWAQHLRRPVLFSQALGSLLQDTSYLLLEVGPRSSLSALARQQVSLEQRKHIYASIGDGTDLHAQWRCVLQTLGSLWQTGLEIDWRGFYGQQTRSRVSLPTYAFERHRHWIEIPKASTSHIDSLPVSVVPIPSVNPLTLQQTEVAMTALPTSAPEGASSDGVKQLVVSLLDVLEDVSGLELALSPQDSTFIELGLDSLTLTQAALQLKKEFGVKVTFRQLMEDYCTPESLAAYLHANMPEEKRPQSALTPEAPSVVQAGLSPVVATMSPLTGAADATMRYVIDQQLLIMQQQLALLGGATPTVAPHAAPPAQSSTSAPVTLVPETEDASEAVGDSPHKNKKIDVDNSKKAFGAIARISTVRGELTPMQRARLDAFVRRYNSRTAKSKSFTQEHRKVLADPRVVSGFRPAIKELIYPIVVDRSAGSKLWDLDGNEYVDVLNGFGCNYFGWQPEFVTKAVMQQLQRGHEIGPQSPLAAECAKLFCEFTGFDRAAFCNTGSEAVMGCMRVARTVTGRNTIALFAGSYHGIFDEVIVRGNKKLKAFPAAPGIMRSTAENVLVLDYGTDESLQILRERADDLAAVLIEPVQSRRPDFQPREFLQELRRITEASGTVYIFDEVITGFRTEPGGAQAYFGVKADIASYGKVVGGGLPIGVIAGKREYMDALDGGDWQFGDDSGPTVGVTYFAGTFVRHPLALAAVKSVLMYLKAEGPQLQQRMNAKTAAFVAELNGWFTQVGAPLVLRHFSSLWKAFYTDEQPYGDVLFAMLRDRGVHIWDGFPCFWTTAHSDADIAFVVEAFKKSVIEMQDSGFCRRASDQPTGCSLAPTIRRCRRPSRA
ncbi:MAG: aminotransferase class III-fold pyridoxal phosphate-dependent enzyme [Myxococcota bacterium]